MPEPPRGVERTGYPLTVASIEELEARVAALEDQVVLIRQDAAAARVLAGGADRDVSAFAARLDAHKALLQALRETQIEHADRFDNLEREMREGFGTLSIGQSEILMLLSRIADRPDS